MRAIDAGRPRGARQRPGRWRAGRGARGARPLARARGRLGERPSCRSASGRSWTSDAAVRERLLAANARAARGAAEELRGPRAAERQGQLRRGRAPARSRRRIARGRRAARARCDGLPEAAGYYERIRLGELVAAEVERRREEDATRALAALEPLAVARRRSEPGAPDAAFNLAFLVERERAREFTAAVAASPTSSATGSPSATSARCRPYSFAEAELDAGSRVMGLITGLLTLPLAPVRGTVVDRREAPGAGRARAVRRVGDRSTRAARAGGRARERRDSTRRRSRRPRTR